MFRFTETGKEFGIDMLSKHTMHSDVATYIACSGEFFIRKRKHHHRHTNSWNSQPSSGPSTQPVDEIVHDGRRPESQQGTQTPHSPAEYTLYIDNDSGTYRPDKSVLPNLREFIEANFPGLHVVTMHWEEKELQDMKKAQREAKKQAGRMINMVMNMSQSSISSAESELDDREDGWEQGHKSKREAALEALEDPHKVKDAVKAIVPGMHK